MSLFRASLSSAAVLLFVAGCSGANTAVSPTPSVPVTAGAQQEIQSFGLTSEAAGKPTIAKVSRIRPKQTQTITITGTGFGHSQPYNGDGNGYLVFYDLTGGWAAGCTLQLEGGDCLVTVNVTSWTNTKITVA